MWYGRPICVDSKVRTVVVVVQTTVETVKTVGNANNSHARMLSYTIPYIMTRHLHVSTFTLSSLSLAYLIWPLGGSVASSYVVLNLEILVGNIHFIYTPSPTHTRADQHTPQQ